MLGDLTTPIVDEDDRNRAQEVAYSLLLQGPQGVATLIVVAGNRDLDSDIRIAALDTMATSDDEATVLPPLLEALRDPELWLAMRAALALAELGAPGLEALHAVVGDPDASTLARCAANEALGYQYAE